MPKLYFDSTRYSALPLHAGNVPPWLAQRMTKLGGAIAEAIILEHGKSAILQRLSDPFWFQMLGVVMGIDWHSSGITTSAMAALKKAINPRFTEFGIYICGGKGKHSRHTPDELLALGERTGLNGNELIRCSKLSAKVDNTAIQDGFQIYFHTFVVTNTGEWAVVQQGMNNSNGLARRYHWHSEKVDSFVETPHTFVYGKNQGEILNLTDTRAQPTKAGILDLTKESPARMLPEIEKILVSSHHEVADNDVNLKRLAGILELAHEKGIRDFESLLLLEGLGPRTLQLLTLASEIIHGTPSCFNDPASLPFANGGNDPFPLVSKVHNETILYLKVAVENAKIPDAEKNEAIKNLMLVTRNLEKGFDLAPNAFNKVITGDRADAYPYGGSTVFGKSDPKKDSQQLSLF